MLVKSNIQAETSGSHHNQNPLLVPNLPPCSCFLVLYFIF